MPWDRSTHKLEHFPAQLVPSRPSPLWSEIPVVSSGQGWLGRPAGNFSGSGMLSHATAQGALRCEAVIELSGVGLGEQPAPPGLTQEHPWLSLGQWVRQYLTHRSSIGLCSPPVGQFGESLTCTMALAAGFSILLHF